MKRLIVLLVIILFVSPVSAQTLYSTDGEPIAEIVNVGPPNWAKVWIPELHRFAVISRDTGDVVQFMREATVTEAWSIYNVDGLYFKSSDEYADRTSFYVEPCPECYDIFPIDIGYIE